MLRPVLDPVLGREILARYTTFAGSVGAPAPMEHLAPAGAAQPARYETYVENLHQVTQAIRKNYLINLQLDLRFLALQLASAVEQAEKTESRRLQMLERQVTLLQEENGRLKAGSPAPALAPRGEKDARTREIRPFTAGNIARNARLAARTPLPPPVARQPEETSGPSVLPGRQVPLAAAPAQMVLPDGGRPTTPGSHAPETARGSAPSAGPERTPSRPRASEPAAAPILRTQPSGNPSGEENRRMTARDLPEKEMANPVRPDLPTSHPAPSPVRDPSRSDPARPVSVPLGHTDPNEQDDWAAPLPDPRPARLQRPEPARRILRTDGAERASTRQGTPTAVPTSPSSSGKTKTAPRSGQSINGTRSADTVKKSEKNTVPKPAEEKSAGQKKAQTPAVQSLTPQTRLPQSTAGQSTAWQSGAQRVPAWQIQPPQSLTPERRDERVLSAPPLVHADHSTAPAAETQHSGAVQARTEAPRRESGLPVSEKTVRPAAPAPEAAPMVLAVSSSGTAEQPGRASRLSADAQRAAAASRTAARKDPAIIAPGDFRREPAPAPRTADSAARQITASRQAEPESAAAASRPGQKSAAPLSLFAGKPDSLPEREIRQSPTPSSIPSAAPPAAAPPLVHRIPAAGENAETPGQSYAAGSHTAAAVPIPAEKTVRRTEAPGQADKMSGRSSAAPSGTASVGNISGQDRNGGPAPLSGSKAARPDLPPPTSLRTPPPFVRVPLITTAVPLPEMLSHGVSAPEPAVPDRGQGLARTETPRLWSAAPLTGTAAFRVPDSFPGPAAGNGPAVPAALSGISPVLLPGQTGTSAAGAAGKALPQKTATAAPGPSVPAGSPAAMELRRTPVLAQAPSPSGGSAWESDGIRTVHRTTTRRETRQETSSTVSVRVPGESVSRPVPQTFGPAEVERIADEVYRQIEDRLRSEKMRRGM